MNAQQAVPPNRDSGVEHPRLGTAALMVGALIVCLAIIDTTAGLPFSMPRSWYVNRALWYFIALGSFAAAYFFLRGGPSGAELEISPDRADRFESVVLYTGSGCHLCEQALETLSSYSQFLPPIEQVDIQSDPRLLELYANCIPVVEIDGKVRFRGEVNEVLLRRLINGEPVEN